MRIGKHYILMLMVLLTAGCSDKMDDVLPTTNPTTPSVTPIEQEEGDLIAFDGEIDKDAVTRVGIEGKPVVYGVGSNGAEPPTYDYHFALDVRDDLRSQGFGVFAYYTGDHTLADSDVAPGYVPSADNSKVTSTWVDLDKQIVMLNQKVYWSAGNWTYTPKRYWPGNDKKMTFFAYAPWDNTYCPSIGTSGVDYTANTIGTPMTFTSQVKIPTLTWNMSDQRDILWGMKSDLSDLFPNIDLIRPAGNKVSFGFKHALARVKFRIYSFLNPNKYTVGSGILLNNGNTADVIEYTSDNPEDAALLGKYVFLARAQDPTTPLTTQCHKLETGTGKVVITGFKLKNVYRRGTLSLWNADSNTPSWSDKGNLSTTDNPYLPAPLNERVFMNLDGYDAEDNPPMSDFNDPPAEPIALTYPTGVSTLTAETDTDDDFEHYILFIPQTTTEAGDRIQIELTYKVLIPYKLYDTYTWDEINQPEISGPHSDSPIKTGVLGLKGDAHTLSADLNVDLEANRSYNVVIGLGDKMYIRFEVNNWDDEHEIYLPVFE